MTSIIAIAAPHGPIYRNNKWLSNVCLAQKRLFLRRVVTILAASFTYVNKSAFLSVDFIFRGFQYYPNCDGDRVVVTGTGKAPRDNNFMSIIALARSTPA